MTSNAVPLVCPNCGYKLGEQELFRSFEHRVAEWLGAEVCASQNPDFDVWKCTEFPNITIQVKFANPYDPGPKSNKGETWAFNHNQLNPDAPDYFILFGLIDEEEFCFLLTREAFITHSSKNHTGGRILFMTPHRFSRRGRPGRTYVHENKAWKYEIPDPEENLIERLRLYETFKQERLF